MRKATAIAITFILSFIGLTSTFAVTTLTPVHKNFSVTSGTYKIAFQGPLSGPESAFGLSQLESVRYAIKVFEDKYPQIKINLILIDDKGDPAVAQSIVPSYIKDQTILGVIGPSYSGSSGISLPFYKSEGLTSISSSASRLSLTDPTSSLFTKDIFHRTTSFGVKEAEAIAQLAVNGKTNPKIFVVGVLNDPSGSQLSKNTINALKKVTGSSLVGFEEVKEDNSNANSVINSIIGNSADAVVFTGYSSSATTFLTRLRGAGSKATFVAGTNLYLDKEFKVLSNEIAGGVKIVGIPRIRDVSLELYASYKNLTGSEPGDFSIPTIDATNVYLDGILAGAVNRKLMFDYLKTYKGAGLLKRGISFDLFGDLIENSFVGYDYSTGSYVLIPSTLTLSQQGKSPSPAASVPVSIPFNSDLVPTPDFTDIYLPILKNIQIEPDINAKIDATDRITFPTNLVVSLSIKYHRNAVHAIKFGMRQNSSGPTNNCAPIQYPIYIPSGGVLEKVGNRKNLPGLTKREKVGDWFLDSYRIVVPAYSNEFLEPCLNDYSLAFIQMYDVSGKFKSILYGYSREKANFIEAGQGIRENPLLPENSCPRINVNGGEFSNSPTLCEDSANYLNASFRISNDLVANSKAKAAADKAAADKAAADKAKVKERTILCLKGKSSLKVIGKNPKCPLGYKVKK